MPPQLVAMVVAEQAGRDGIDHAELGAQRTWPGAGQVRKDRRSVPS